jgi:hypothetical protein
MTTKQSKFVLGNGAPIRPHIVIEINPEGSSTLKTYGNLTIMAVVDVLMSQLAGVWQQMVKQSMSPVRDSNGQPIVHLNSGQPIPDAAVEPGEPV